MHAIILVMEGTMRGVEWGKQPFLELLRIVTWTHVSVDSDCGSRGPYDRGILPN